MGTLGYLWRGLTALPLLMLADCGQSGTVYAVSPDVARRDLVGTRIPDLAFGMVAHAEPAVSTDGGVEWQIIRGGDSAATPDGMPRHEVMALSATLARADEGTLITIDIAPAAGINGSIFAKNLSEHPAIADMFRAIAREAVDAGLSHRPFEFGNVSAHIALATVSMLPQIAQQADEAARQSEQRDRDAIDDAYRRDSAGQ